MTNKIRRKLDYWQKALGLEEYEVVVEKHSKMQVTSANGEAGANVVGSSLSKQEGIITIFTTRPLREDDVVHEFVHMRYPEFTEEQVVAETASLILSRDSIYQEGNRVLNSKERAA